MSLEITTIRTTAELAVQLPQWQKFLRAHVRGSNLHNDPLNIQIALASSNRLTPFIVVVREHGAIRCIAPFYTERTRFRLKLSVLNLASLPIRMMKLFGDQIICAEGGDADSWLAAVFDTLQQQRGRFGLISFFNLDCSGRLFQYCTAAPGRQKWFRFVRASPQVEKVHQIRLPSSHDAYMAGLSSSTRQNLRRTTRKFFSDGRAELVKITRPDQVPAFLAQLDAVSEKTWQGKTFGLNRRDTAPTRQRFEHLAGQGWLRSYVLLHDKRPVAYEVGCQYGGTYYGLDCGFDQDWGHAGPGSIVIHLAIEDLFKENRPDLLDFGFGDAAYKRSFSNAVHDTVSAYLVPRNHWRPIINMQSGLNLVFLQVQAALVKTRLDNVVRRALKHKRGKRQEKQTP